MQYKCDKCNDSGMILGSYNFDCSACEAATDRVALEAFIESLPAMGEQEQAWRIHQRALAMAPKQDEAEELPEGWRIAERATCYTLLNGNTVVAILASPDAKENAAIIARMLTAPAVANGALTDAQINWHAKNIYGIAATAQEVEFAKSILAAAGPDAALVKALEDIIAIKDKMFGSDWQEIDEVRTIARAALSGAKGN